jgi:hypothetical protein
VGFASRAVTLYVAAGAVPFGEEAGAEPAEPAALAWWYWDGAAWAPLAVRDETAAFTRRGLVTFVGPADFRASFRFGREAFWMRVSVERGGWRHPPRLERVLDPYLAGPTDWRLYYPSRLGASAPLRAFVEFMRGRLRTPGRA